MRSQLGDYSKQEFIDLAIQLQDVIDTHVQEKRGLQSSLEAMSTQIPALQQRIDELEDGPQLTGEEMDELEQLRGENKALREKMESLRDRYDKLQELNEKYQAKLLDQI